MLQLNTYTRHIWLRIKWRCNLVLGCIVYGVHRTCTHNSTWQTEVHQRACEDHYFVGCLDQTCVLCFATWLLFWLFCVCLWQIAVGLLLLYLFLCVSVTDYSWPIILTSVCLCDWLQLTYYTYFCVSLWQIAVDLLYLFLCASVTDCSWPTIPISVCLCDWLQLAPVQGFPIPEIDSKSQQFLSKHRLELLDKKRLLQQVQQNPWSLLLL